jgi:purine nucleosidase
MGSVGGDPEDSFAIMLALSSPELIVEGLTIVQGNVPVGKGYSNAVHLLGLLGRSDIPVFAGFARPMNSARTRQIEGLERREALEQIAPPVEPPPGHPHAVDFLIEAVVGSPGELTLVTIGPLSNVAGALLRDPSIAQKVKGLVVMGGAATVPGNITPAAEFNIWADPEAAAVVFRSGIPMTMVGLDVCEQTHLKGEAIRTLENGPSELAHFVAQSALPWLELRRRFSGADDLHLYDSLAVAVAFRPALVSTREAYVAVETDGHYTAGATVTYLQPKKEPNATVALQVDAGEFEDLFASRVIRPTAEKP